MKYNSYVSIRGDKLLENESILGIHCWHNDHI
uniref:Uncharacterized protein n=1 Tax=Anguilla anguilla TaxID=7936 RepID=A0A0E9T9W1_ANGAN